ncbi:MAG: glycerophosphodiester phosphodiesterase [Chloroflexi bacterium]|nr:glycerophosphodiester phosphodiesterase [Chloroflexota bacterium]
MSAPIVIAHAAAAGEAPANTLAGVRASLESAGAMEIDLHLCADGVPVLLHDDTLDRTTNLSGPVRDASLADLARVDAGEGEHVPSLDKVLDLVAGRIDVMCELKVAPDRPDDGPALLDSTLEVIRRHGAESWTALHSFDHDLVERARTLAPEIEAAMIAMPMGGAGLETLAARAAEHGAGAISLFHAVVAPHAVEIARRHDLKLWAWTADGPDDWTRLAEAGVDGIITNQPAALRAWNESRASA